MSQFFGAIGTLLAWTVGLPIDIMYRLQQVVLELPNSRACENEGLHPLRRRLILADYMGLIYMAKVHPQEMGSDVVGVL